MPIEANESGLIAAHFAMYVEETERSPRDMTLQKLKVNPLENTKKPTGDPNCPFQVRRAKHIVQRILKSNFRFSGCFEGTRHRCWSFWSRKQ